MDLGGHEAPTSADQERDGETRARGRRRHVWPLIVLVLIVLTGMAYSFVWNPWYHHVSSWNTPSDIWATLRAAQYVTWGGEGQIYNNPAAYQTFPGIAVLLAPVAKLVGVWHLSTSFPLTLARPSAWLLLGPVALATGAVLVLPLDELARRLGLDARRRFVLSAGEGILVWPVVALWGHPEDPLALALGVWGLLAVMDARWWRVAGFFAAAIVVQPLIILVVPLVFAYVPFTRWLALGGVMASPTLLLLLAPLVQEWGPTTRSLLHQPNFPIHNHETPWMSVAPLISAGHSSIVRVARYVTVPGGRHRLVEASVKAVVAPVVAAGPGRIIAVVIAVVIGLLVMVRKPSAPLVIWLAALALSLRCVFEPVMVPYYLMPGLALVLVVAARGTMARFVMAMILASACTLLSYRYLSPWAYYGAMTTSLGAVFAVSWPGSTAVSSTTRGSVRGGASRDPSDPGTAEEHHVTRRG